MKQNNLNEREKISFRKFFCKKFERKMEAKKFINFEGNRKRVHSLPGLPNESGDFNLIRR